MRAHSDFGIYRNHGINPLQTHGINEWIMRMELFTNKVINMFLKKSQYHNG